MRTKNSDIVVKIFLVVVAVILVGLIIAWNTGVFKDKKKDLNEGTERINSAISSMAEFDLLVYDGGTVTGSLLMDLIEESNDDGGRLEGVEITYLTLETMKGSNPVAVSYPSPAPEKTDEKYINPNGVFKGEVVRDDNEVITELKFTQQK